MGVARLSIERPIRNTVEHEKRAGLLPMYGSKEDERHERH
jgi:hypothetical protein